MTEQGEPAKPRRRTPVILMALLAFAAATTASMAVTCSLMNRESENHANNNAPPDPPPKKHPVDGTLLPVIADEDGANPLPPELKKFFGSRPKMIKSIADRATRNIGAQKALPTIFIPATRKLPAPDGVTVVIRDLQGFSDDCGCSGEIVGGIARLAGVVPETVMTMPGQKNPNRRFIIVGKLFEQLQVRRMPMITAGIVHQIPQRIFAFARIFEALGNVTWIPDVDEMTEYAKERLADGRPIDFSPLDKWRAVPGAPLSIEGLDAQLRLGKTIEDPGEFSLSGVTPDGVQKVTQPVRLPAPDDRGRTALIFARWHPLRDPGSYFDPLFGKEHYSVIRGGTRQDMEASAFNRLSQVGDQVKGAWVTSWEESMTRASEPDPIIALVVDRAEFDAGHSGISDPGFAKTDQRPALLSATAGCRSCHTAAYDAWEQSKHSHAFQTLFDLRKHTDSRCTTCHIQQGIPIDNGKLDSMPQHRGVTCMTCHARGVPVKQVCTQCHTKHTDPMSKYLAHIKDICPGGVNKPAIGPVDAACDRERMMK